MLWNAARESLTAMAKKSVYQSLLVVVGVGLVCMWTAVPGVFIIDDTHYISTIVALRSGGFSLPLPDGVPLSVELFAFDPAPPPAEQLRPSLSPTAPPLYAFLAEPFAAVGGVRGLILMNALAFGAGILLVFHFARRLATRRETAWAAAVTFALGGFALDYAQGIWPHMQSVALTAAAFYLTYLLRQGGRWIPLGVGAGLLMALATGLRYQNVAYAVGLGATLLLLGPRRLLSTGVYMASFLAGLLPAAAVNGIRLGIFNPITKGPGYLSSPLASHPDSAARWVEPLHVLWAKVIDFSAHPPIGKTGGTEWFWHPDAQGAFVIAGALKKAWLQSSPWILLGLVVLVMSFRHPLVAPGSPLNRERRAAALVVACVLAVFALAGFARHDGLSFTQRYFLELTPLLAVFVALELEEGWATRWPLVVGAVLGVALSSAALVLSPGSPARSVLLMKVPLALGFAFLAIGLSARWKVSWAPRALIAGWVTCVVWAAAVHLGDDAKASRLFRRHNADRARELAEHLPDRSAYLTTAGGKVAVGPVALDRSVFALDLMLDKGRDSRLLTEAFFQAGYRVFADVATIPPNHFRKLTQGLTVTPVYGGAQPIVELSAGASPDPP